EYATLINAEAGRLGRMVDDLLDLDRLESGRVDLQIAAVDVNAVVRDLLVEARRSAPDHYVESELGPETIVVHADSDKLTQIIKNLLSNAIKYSPGGGRVRLLASIESKESELLHVQVQDDGLGVPPESLAAIFERYVRVESAERRAIKGV